MKATSLTRSEQPQSPLSILHPLLYNLQLLQVTLVKFPPSIRDEAVAVDVGVGQGEAEEIQVSPEVGEVATLATLVPPPVLPATRVLVIQMSLQTSQFVKSIIPGEKARLSVVSHSSAPGKTRLHQNETSASLIF